MKRGLLLWITAFLVLLSRTICCAQVNIGSDGRDGPFNPIASIAINMATHPDGIYQYTSVNIPANVTVTFIPNANNTPVVWLVQGDVVIKGLVGLWGNQAGGLAGGLGGPGGYRGGTSGPSPTSGQGPGGGLPGVASLGGFASYGSLGYQSGDLPKPGPTYGNQFLVPLIGGSGGGGSTAGKGGGGGGGAILIATSGMIQVDGRIFAWGAGNSTPNSPYWYGVGSGGAVRLVASRIIGSGEIRADIGNPSEGLGRVRFDSYENDYNGSTTGVFSQGFQPIIIPSAGQLPQLTVTSLAGVPVSASPTGVLSTPDALIAAQQANPIPIVVQCLNLPLNTQITVSVKPMNGSPVSAVGYNDTGTFALSMATVSINIPRGGGLIYATAATSR